MTFMSQNLILILAKLKFKSKAIINRFYGLKLKRRKMTILLFFIFKNVRPFSGINIQKLKYMTLSKSKLFGIKKKKWIFFLCYKMLFDMK